MSSNLPPGVSDSDLPGNRSEYIAEEEFIEWMMDRFWEENLTIGEMYLAVSAGIIYVKAGRVKEKNIGKIQRQRKSKSKEMNIRIT